MTDYDKRHYLRYPAELNEMVNVYYLDEQTKKTGQRLGLGENESFKGCCVVFVGDVDFRNGQEVFCECGALPRVKARVVWIKKLENNITKVGFSFI